MSKKLDITFVNIIVNKRRNVMQSSKNTIKVKKESSFEKEFKFVVGYEPIKMELERIIDIMNNPQKYKALGVTTPRGVLLDGKPGLGKTLMANCFIRASGRKAFVCRKDKPNGDFVKEIKAVYEKAKENAPSIVFLDDMDKYANEDEKHQNAEEYVTIQSCIDETKNSEVFTIATTNDLRNLPDSLLRAGRIDKRFTLKNPNVKDLEEIVKYYISKKKFVGKIDAKQIAIILNGCSCAELETIINEAGIYAGFENRECIDMNDIIRASMRVIFRAPEVLSNEQQKYIKEIAYHEAGHAVVAEVLEPQSVNIVSVKKYSGDIGGVTSYYQDEGYFYDKKYMENRVISLLAGKAATEIVFGKVDIGAGEDIRRAMRITQRFVDDYCSYSFDCYEFLDSISNEFLERKERKIYCEIERYYQMAKKLLIQNREFLDKIATALIEKETIITQDVQRIKESCIIFAST